MNGYLTNSTLGSLHRYVMGKWYGQQMFDLMTKNGYVVDHMNNKHTDCRISNLEFLKKTYNTAKGQTFDVDSKEMQYHIAVNLFKDFSTGYYQITIGCNDNIVRETADGKIEHIAAIMLLYNCDYSIVINDAENILRIYETKGYIDIGKTNACSCKERKAIDLHLTEEEQKSAVVIRNGVHYLVLGTGQAFLNSVNYEEGWKPPEE